MEPNCTCLLLTLLLLPIIIWLAEMLTLLRNINFQFLAVFQDSTQREHTSICADVLLIEWFVLALF